MENESKLPKSLQRSEIPQAYEIAPGMKSEEMKEIFFDSDAIVEQPERVYRLDSSGHRYYYKFDEHDNPEFFVSVTTLIKQTTPTSPHLIKWIADMGHEESKNYAQERAEYGTFLHAEIATLLINRTYDLDKLRNNLRDYMEREKLPSTFINYEDELKKDVAAFAQFMIEHKVKPMAVEVVLTHPEHGYGGALDIVCTMEIEEKGLWGEVYKTGQNAGKPKETKKTISVAAIVDIKSGRKGFYEENEIQLGMYREMWNRHFESMPVSRIFNWSPKAWRGSKPTYNLKDQTNSPNLSKIPHLINLAKIEDDKRERSFSIVEGVLDVSKGLSGNIQTMDIAEVVKRRRKEKAGELTPEKD